MEALIQWLTVFILTKANSMNESVLPHLPGQKKSAHGRNNSAKDGFNPRCHLVSRYRALCEIPTYLRQLTRALRCGILCHPFRRTLSGPFGRLPFHPFSPGRTLFGRISCFDLRFNGFLIRRLYPAALFVKGIGEIFTRGKHCFNHGRVPSYEGRLYECIRAYPGKPTHRAAPSHRGGRR